MGYQSNYGDYQSEDYSNRPKNQQSYDKQSDAQLAATIAASERAAKNSVAYTKEVAQFGDNISKSGAKSNLQDAITGSREASALKRAEEDDKARNLASESAKNRETDTLQKNAANASMNAGTFDSNATQKTINAADNRTKEAGQQSSIEQAKIAAQAQVSAAILGNRPSYGGYW